MVNDWLQPKPRRSVKTEEVHEQWLDRTGATQKCFFPLLFRVRLCLFIQSSTGGQTNKKPVDRSREDSKMAPPPGRPGREKGA